MFHVKQRKGKVMPNSHYCTLTYLHFFTQLIHVIDILLYGKFTFAYVRNVVQ